MSVRLHEILDLLEEMAPAGLAESWDNPGLQVGAPDQKVAKLRLSLDPTIEALRRTAEAGAQLLLTHHPLIFEPLRSLDLRAYPGDVLAEAIGAGIAIIACHTNLDKAAGGINDILASMLSLEGVEVLQSHGQEPGAGLGRIGRLPKEQPAADFADQVARVLGAGRPRLHGDPRMPVRRVAVVGGSGGSLAALAAERGADALVSGDLGHHQTLEAARLGLILVDAGHFGTERPALRVFGERLRERVAARGWQLEVETDDDELDPMDNGSRV